MPYIVRPGEPYPWFAGTSLAMDKIIGLNNMTLQDQMRQGAEVRAEDRQLAGEGRHNAEYDRRTGETRAYGEKQAGAERKRKGEADSLMLKTLQASGMLPRSPELDGTGVAARGGVDLDMNQLVRMYAEKVQRDQQAARAKTLQGQLGVGMPTPGTMTGPADPADGIGQYKPGTPGVEFIDPADVVTIANQRRYDAESKIRGENTVSDNQRQDQALQIRQQQLQIARDRLGAAARRKDLSPEDAQQVQIALQVLNDPQASPEEYAQAFMVARRHDYAPVGAAIQRTESPQDTAEARVMRGKIDDLRSRHRAAERHKSGYVRETAPEIQQQIDVLEAEYVKKFGAAATRPVGSRGASPAGQQTSPEREALIEALR